MVCQNRLNMKKIRTHYDNLKVSRNAPIEVIRAAYRTLSQKYHPDRNPGDSEAVRIMAIINTSYEVLSDQKKRQEHDEWIALQENTNTNEPFVKVETKPTHPTASKQKKKSLRIKAREIIVHVLRYWLFYGIAILILWAVLDDTKSTPVAGPKPYQRTPPSENPQYVKPLYAPNGEPWPMFASYIKGFPQLKTSGHSMITIDNSRNDSEVFVKLISLNENKAYPVRQFYIPAFAKFTLNNVSVGSYDIRYRDLVSGLLSRSESFALEETRTNEGINYSDFTLTLYKVKNGNMQTYNLSEAEF
jgi:curved DNA-binding protein CbpA